MSTFAANGPNRPCARHLHERFLMEPCRAGWGNLKSPFRFGRRLPALASLVALVVFLPLCMQGCALQRRAAGVGKQSDLTIEDKRVKRLLAGDLDDFEQALKEIMATFQEDIWRQTSSRNIRRQAKGWRSMLLDRYRDALDNKSPLAGLLDAWALGEQTLIHLRSADARRHFGSQWPVAYHAAEQVDALVEAIVQTYLSADAVALARQNIEAYVASEPLIERKSFLGRLFDFESHLFSVVDIGQQTVDTVAAVPMMPLRTAEGIQRSTASLADFNQTASRFTNVVERLPQQIRRELEALLTVSDDRFSTAGAMLRDARDAADTFDRLALHSTDLSRDVRLTLGEAGRTAATLSETGEAIAAAASELDNLAQTLSELIRQFNTASGPPAGALDPQGGGFDVSVYADAAVAIGDAAIRLREATHEIRLLVELTGRERTGRGRPFDVLDYAEAARAIEAGGSQVRALLEDARGAVDATGLSAAGAQVRTQVVPLLDETEARMLRFVNMLTVRIALLIAFFFLAATLYQWLKHRLLTR